MKVDAPGPDRRGWKRSHSEIDPNLLPAGWKKRVADGANFVLQETWAPHTKLHRPLRVVSFASSQISQVKANDPHYDAKVWPVAHPHGTGSLHSEIGAGSPNNYARNRALCVQSWFRKTALWVFWKLDCLIKLELFRSNYRKTKGKSDDPNVFTRIFGSTVPKNIPESAAWWRIA